MSKFQSAYRRLHSYETALLWVQNNIFVSLDAGRSTALLILDLLTTYDKINHHILLQRLQYWTGFSSTALNLLCSFLSDRSQIVTFKLKSLPNLLEYGIPQDSVLGPLLYSLYTTPFLSVISNYPGIQCHFYTDDTQIYLLFSPELTSLALSTIESCIRYKFLWMTSNKLPVNPNKTEYLLFNPSNINPSVNTINLDSNIISPSDSANFLCP